jgi:hypothetical protein
MEKSRAQKYEINYNSLQKFVWVTFLRPSKEFKQWEMARDACPQGRQINGIVNCER